MSIAERTYSFRASSDFGTRLSAARADIVSLAERGPEVRDWLVRELEMAFARRIRVAPEIGRDQSAFIRTSVELLVSVTEKVTSGLALSELYSADRETDQEADSFIQGAMKATAPVWRE